jgi:hypothetical protein
MSIHVTRYYRLTEVEAHEYALEMWSWLRDNPTRSKEDFHHVYPDYPRGFLFDCALCHFYRYGEYGIEHEGEGCRSCTLGNPKLNGTENINSCANENFTTWSDSEDSVVRIIAAGQIVRMISKGLATLMKEMSV